jgi:hypothetical protein
MPTLLPSVVRKDLSPTLCDPTGNHDADPVSCLPMQVMQALSIPWAAPPATPLPHPEPCSDPLCATSDIGCPRKQAIAPFTLPFRAYTKTLRPSGLCDWTHRCVPGPVAEAFQGSRMSQYDVTIELGRLRRRGQQRCSRAGVAWPGGVSGLIEEDNGVGAGSHDCKDRL